MYRIRAITLSLFVALVLCLSALIPSTAQAISRDVVISRGKVWLGAVRVDPKTGKRSIGVPYSQGLYAFEDGSAVPTSGAGARASYRTDCSGFVSMCWDLRDYRGNPYSTSTLEMGKNKSTAFHLTQITQAELQPGDALLKSVVWYPKGTGHVVIFAGWSKADMSEYWALEQTGPGTKLSKRPYGQAGYRAVRFDGIGGFDRAKVTYGDAFTVSGMVSSSPTASVAATGGVVELSQRVADGSFETLVGNVALDANGRFSFSHVPLKSGYFVVSYKDTTMPSQDRVLFSADVTVAPGLSAVSGNGSKLRRRRSYVFYGYVSPRVASSMLVYKYNPKSRRYVLYSTKRASVGYAPDPRGYRFTTKWKPTVAGKYRLSWRTVTPSGMSYAASANRYITVK